MNYHLDSAQHLHRFARELMSMYLPTAWPGLVDVQLDRAYNHALSAITESTCKRDLGTARTLCQRIRSTQDRVATTIANGA